LALVLGGVLAVTLLGIIGGAITVIVMTLREPPSPTVAGHLSPTQPAPIAAGASPAPAPIEPPVDGAPMEPLAVPIAAASPPEAATEPEPTEAPAGREEPEPEPTRRARRPRNQRALSPARAPTPTPPSSSSAEPQGIDNATFIRVLSRHEGEIDRCYFTAYPNPPAPRVPLQLEIGVTPAGVVTSARARGGPIGLTACVQRVLLTMRFPSRPNGSRVRSSITLYDNR
jgi:hypothetical protein